MAVFHCLILIPIFAIFSSSDASTKECEQCSKVMREGGKAPLEEFISSRKELNLNLIFTDIPNCVVSYQPTDVEVLSESCIESVSDSCHLQNVTVQFSKAVIKCRLLLPIEPNEIIEHTIQPIFDIITDLFPNCGIDLMPPVKPDMAAAEQCIAQKFAETPTEDKRTKGDMIYNVKDFTVVLRLNVTAVEGKDNKFNGYDIFPVAAKLDSFECSPSDSSSFGRICSCFVQEKLPEYKFAISFGRINCFGRITEDIPLDKVFCLNNKIA